MASMQDNTNDTLNENMPFERYFQPDAFLHHEQSYYDDARDAVSHGVQFQMPHFMQGGPPMLAAGGGAEVLSAGDGAWFTNNGFMPMFSGANQKYPEQPVQQESETNLVPAPGPTIPIPQDLSSLIASGVIDPQQPLSTHHLAALASATSARAGAPAAPPGIGLYSASGFDLLSVLAKVATRPNPTVKLGPVDLTSSFVVVDVRRHDHPIIYCSPNFCLLTGYPEQEVLGRNCRFLQSPSGVLAKGEHRRFSSNEAAAHLRKHLSQDKECQTTIINYRKGGGAFINLVTVIPIAGDDGKVVYHVGFQIDLTEQPNAILEKLKDGSYMVNFGANNPLGILVGPAAAASSSLPNPGLTHPKKPSIGAESMSKSLQPLLDGIGDEKEREANHPLSLLLLSALPDFVHVLSLKGAFLYIAPSISHVLGYTPGELVGKALSDICHPADVIPVMRELKESSTVDDDVGRAKQVDLLFRARNKAGMYVWVESTGRLHVEPGKGRKAIVLSGRVRGMVDVNVTVGDGVWGTMSSLAAGAKVLSVSEGVKDMLGYEKDEVVGRPLSSLFSEENDRILLHNMLAGSGQMRCRIVHKNRASTVDAAIAVYHTPSPTNAEAAIVFQIAPIAAAMIGAGRDRKRLFEELCTTRNSSWQYELQQLRIKNQQLEDEIRTLEEVRSNSTSVASSSSSVSPTPAPANLHFTAPMTIRPPAPPPVPSIVPHGPAMMPNAMVPAPTPLPQAGGGWDYQQYQPPPPQVWSPIVTVPPITPSTMTTPITPAQPVDPWVQHTRIMQQHHQALLKRSWDAANSHDGGG